MVATAKLILRSNGCEETRAVWALGRLQSTQKEQKRSNMHKAALRRFSSRLEHSRLCASPA